MIRAAVINVPIKVGAKAWEACFDATADRADVFGVNETFTRAQRDTYAALARARGLDRYGLWCTPNPIFWDPARYRKVSAHVHQLHGPGAGDLARRHPGYNAARCLTVVVLADREDEQEYAILCTHWVPEGVKVPGVWRTWARGVSIAKTQRIIRRHRRAGRVVILMGDLNIHARLRMGMRRWRWVRGIGVDKIGVAWPKSLRLASARAATYLAPTDHKHGVVAGVRVEAA